MTTPEQPTRPDPATDPADVAYTAAVEALRSGVDMAEWFVQLMAAVAVSDHTVGGGGDFELFRRPGSWEAAGCADLIQSAGAYVDPDAVVRDERELLHELLAEDVLRWLAPRVRELHGDALGDRVDQLAADVDTAWRGPGAAE